MKLSERDLNQNRNNIIFVSNPIQKNNECSYGTIKYGDNINNKGSRCNRQTKKNFTFKLNLERIKHNYVMICAPLVQCKMLFPNLNIITTAEINGHKNHGSGWVLLMLATNNRNRNNTIDQNNKIEWTNDDFKKLEGVKKNTIDKKNSHHGSTGYYFSFGNNAAYKIINGSSVAKYCNKKSKNEQKQVRIDDTEKEYEKRCTNEIKNAVKSFSKRLNYIKYFMPTTIDAADNKYDKLKVKSPLYKNTNIDRGCWKTVICVNAQTKELHSEQDVTYTTIAAPKQKSLQSKYSFIYLLHNDYPLHY